MKQRNAPPLGDREQLVMDRLCMPSRRPARASDLVREADVTRVLEPSSEWLEEAKTTTATAVILTATAAVTSHEPTTESGALA